MNITIYGKPACPQCDQVKNYLDARSIPYDYKQLDVDFVREEVVALGARSYPVIVVESGVIHTGLSGLKTYLLANESTRSSGGPTFLAE